LKPENLILIGFMGTGKSTIGRLIAGRLGFRFLDTDALVVESAGTEIPEIFRKEGEEGFRQRESAVLESLQGTARCVVATGGGIVLREQNRALLRNLGLVVLLTASEDAIFERVSRNSRRPLLETTDPRATVQEMLTARAPLYALAAEWALDNTELSHGQAADAVIEQARQRFSWQVAP
jgi:shikimate kinase